MKRNTLSIRTELGGLPPLPPWRRVARRLFKVLSQFLVWLCTHSEVRGLENFPKQGPVLIVINHLGDADAFLGLAVAPVCIDTIAKQELYDIPIIEYRSKVTAFGFAESCQSILRGSMCKRR